MKWRMQRQVGFGRRRTGGAWRGESSNPIAEEEASARMVTCAIHSEAHFVDVTVPMAGAGAMD